MKKKVSTTKKSRVSDKIVDGLEDFADQLEKPMSKIIKKKMVKNNKIVSVKTMVASCIIHIEFNSGPLKGKFVVMAVKIPPIKYTEIEVAAWKRIELVLNANIDFINGCIDSIEYLDQQDQLRKFNLK